MEKMGKWNRLFAGRGSLADDFCVECGMTPVKEFDVSVVRLMIQIVLFGGGTLSLSMAMMAAVAICDG